MSTDTPAQAPTPSSASVEADAVVAALDGLAVIGDRRLRWLVGALPVLLIVGLLADWLVGAGAITRDLFRLSGALAVLAELVVCYVLFGQVPEALRTVWLRGLIRRSRDGRPAAPAMIDFLKQFEARLNHRWAWAIGGLFVVGALLATYPIQFWLREGRSPFTDWGQWAGFYLTTGPVAYVPVAFIAGLLAWRVGVIAWTVNELGQRFELKLQPSHPDRCGGWRPLGDLCLTSAFVILVPAILFSVWIAVSAWPGYEIYQLWAGLFRNWLLVLCLLALFLFVLPLYRIHEQMTLQRRVVQRELDELSLKIEDLSLTLRQESERLTADEIKKRLDALQAMQQVYDKDQRTPTWPFDWSLFARFVAGLAVPFLSLVGATGPLVSIVEAALALLPK
jgi:hypothetical protein